MELMSLTDIAELLGMTRAGADKLVKRESGFPAPVVVLTGRTRAWDRKAVEKWAREAGRASGTHSR
jgi:predicted DNA-binding transcriptional regulator AlpA